MIRWLLYPLLTLALLVAPGTFLPVDMGPYAAKADQGSAPSPDAGKMSAVAEVNASAGEMHDCGTCGTCAENGDCMAGNGDTACDKTCRTACSTGSLSSFYTPACAITARPGGDKVRIPGSRIAAHLVPASDPPPPRL